jgi:hypothetical protein
VLGGGLEVDLNWIYEHGASYEELYVRLKLG